MANYRILADALLLLHAAYVLFVVLGLPVILIGAWRRWGWVRNFWFRLVHVGCMVFVGCEALADITCPLTILEHHFRTLGGELTYSGEFLAHWVGALLYLDWPQWAFDVLHVAFSLVLLAVFVLIPPRWPWCASGSRIAQPHVS